MAAQKEPAIPWTEHYAILKSAHGIHIQTAERFHREIVSYGAMVAHVFDDMVRERTFVRSTATSHPSIIVINAQDKELGSLLPVMHNVDSVESIILGGDPKQLGPTYITRVTNILGI